MGIKRIIIADDHAIVRIGLKLVLDETDDLSIVDEVSTGDELLLKLENNTFDLVILDLSMPGRDTLDVLKEIKSTRPKLPVVIFTMNPDDIHAVRMIRNGAFAYVHKKTDPEQIISILRTVVGGKRYFTPFQTELLAEMVISPEKEGIEPHELLTDREFQIFFMLASSLKKSEIAEKLSLSKHTVSNHRDSILRKMNMTMNSELTKYAIKHGIIQ